MGHNDRSIIVGSLRPDLIKSREADHTKHTLFHAQKNMIKTIYAYQVPCKGIRFCQGEEDDFTLLGESVQCQPGTHQGKDRLK